MPSIGKDGYSPIRAYMAARRGGYVSNYDKTAQKTIYTKDGADYEYDQRSNNFAKVTKSTDSLGNNVYSRTTTPSSSLVSSTDTMTDEEYLKTTCRKRSTLLG